MELSIDREKVKKGLECCKASTNDDPFRQCSECPYNDISISVQDCRAVLSADALELLREQEPIPVKIHRVSASIGIKCGTCPNCKEGLNSEVYPHWCGFCGQAVKWDG